MSRLEHLLEFFRDDPNDPFNVYALALEYQKTDTAKALAYFQLLLDKHPDYVPSYYHLGKLLQETGSTDEAIKIFEAGIVKAQAKNELKALRELRAALDELML